MPLVLKGLTIATDNEGYFLDPSQWSVEIANQVAAHENISLSDAHWVVIHFIREYYELHQCVPEARTVLKELKTRLSPEQATRKYLYSLFPYGYGQQACKIAGMRKPLKIMLDV
jgi:tRNA 2-thiouridine synthesizing protein E